MDAEQTNNPGLKRFGVKRKALRLSQESLVSGDYFEPSQKLPFVVRPNIANVNLVSWAENNREFIEAQLGQHGALLFRGFGVLSTHDFGRFAQTVCRELMEYGERSSPRTKLHDMVYTSTDHPPDQHILLHNEQSYTLNWPMKILFFCALPAAEGGRTPIADSRKIFARIDPSVVEKLARLGVMYVRNYGDGLGLPWQHVFQTDSKSEVEAHCRVAGIGFEWKTDGRLRTRQVRPAIRKHPRTGETVWFNHALFFHVSSLGAKEREIMLEVIEEDDLPFNTFHGDGSPFEPQVLEELRAAYAEETVSFAWEQSDLLLLDNMLTSHGREPFAGQRKIVVAMGDPFASETPAQPGGGKARQNNPDTIATDS
jgi:alpha-ketoglutarate-dependent taurine dioxygenase